MSKQDRFYYCSCKVRWFNDRWMHCCRHGFFATYDTYALHLDGNGGCIDPWELQPVMRKLIHRDDPTKTRVWTRHRGGQGGYLPTDELAA